jgi:hypothetical protein
MYVILYAVSPICGLIPEAGACANGRKTFAPREPTQRGPGAKREVMHDDGTCRGRAREHVWDPCQVPG